MAGNFFSFSRSVKTNSETSYSEDTGLFLGVNVHGQEATINFINTDVCNEWVFTSM